MIAKLKARYAAWKVWRNEPVQCPSCQQVAPRKVMRGEYCPECYELITSGYGW